MHSMKIKAKPSKNYFEEGSNFQDKGHHSEAVRTYRLAVELDPNNIAAYQCMAEFYTKQKNIPQAAKSEPDKNNNDSDSNKETINLNHIIESNPNTLDNVSTANVDENECDYLGDTGVLHEGIEISI